MKIHQRISLFFLLGAPIATACLERIDEGASRGLQNLPAAGTGGRTTTPQGSGGSNTTPRGTGGTSAGTGGSSASTGGSSASTGGSSAGTGGSSVGTGGTTTPQPDAGTIDPGGGDDPETETPSIIGTRPVVVYTKPDADLEEVETAGEATTLQVSVIFERNCQKCHGGGPGQNLGNFTQIMDLEALITVRSPTVADPTAPRDAGFVGMPFIAPGEPARSRIYQRIARGEMPPDAVTVGALHPPSDDQTRPTASDLSVLHEYIAHCAEAPPDDPGGGEDGGTDPGDDGGGDPPGDGGADPPDPAPRGR